MNGFSSSEIHSTFVPFFGAREIAVSSLRRLFALETAETGDGESETATDRLSECWVVSRNEHSTQPKGKDEVA